jgi:hypothetical protein
LLSFQEDATAVTLARDLQPLYLSSRPGYLDFLGGTHKDCERFIKEIIANKITVVVVLMTSTEIMRFY